MSYIIVKTFICLQCFGIYHNQLTTTLLWKCCLEDCKSQAILSYNFYMMQ